MRASTPSPGPRLRAPSWSASAARATTPVAGAGGRERAQSQPAYSALGTSSLHDPAAEQQRRREWQYRLMWAALAVVAVLGLYAWHDEQTAPGPLKAFMPKRGLGTSRRERAAAAAAKAEQLRRARAAAAALAAADAGPVERTLVLYTVHHDETPLDNLQRENLEFFLEVAVNSEEESPLVDYVFFVPPLPEHPAPLRRIRKAKKASSLSIRRRWPRAGEDGEWEEPPYTQPVFPKAPNVRVVERPHACLGATGLAELLREQQEEEKAAEKAPEEGGEEEEEGADGEGRRRRDGDRDGPWRLDLDAYTHFVLLDSSVRGPFLPRYLHRGRRGSLEQAAAADPWSTPQTRRPWTTVLTDKLGGPGDVALVGPTVSCEEELHVQAPVWATDRRGLALLLEAGVLDCVGERGRAFWERYEAAATRAVMDAGRGVDCLMLRYQGVDLTKLRAEGVACTGGDNPSLPFRNDGLPVNPLEVVFVVARPHLLASDPLLRRYTDYALGRVPLAANEYETPRVQAAVKARKARLAQAVKECGAELDAAHLLARCPECAPPPGQELLDKFLRDHYAQGYDYRFTLPGRRKGRLPHPHCESFVEYNAPDLSA